MSEQKRKFYRTEIRFVVLSDSPVDDVDLATLLLECDAGGDVGKEILRKSEVISTSSMREELIEFGSEPGFFGLDLGTVDADRITFLEGLCVGDEVYWNDPDEGKSSGNAKVHEIRTESGDVESAETIIFLKLMSGSEAEVFPHEITEGWRFDTEHQAMINQLSYGDEVMVNGRVHTICRHVFSSGLNPDDWVLEVCPVGSGERIEVRGSEIN